MAVYCTLVLNERYLTGAIVVAERLRRLDPAHDVVCLASAALPGLIKAELDRHFKTVHVVDTIDAGLSPELALLNRPELRLATTKLHLWALPYEHVVYLDADTLPVRGPFDLLFRPLEEGQVAASPDTGWPDIFNTGVLSLRPSSATFDKLMDALAARVSFDGSDQGLLNEALEWVRLPFVYNVTVSNSYQYQPAYFRFVDNVHILHFTGPTKPWDHGQNSSLRPELEQWWQAHDEAVASPRAGEPIDHTEAFATEYTNYDSSKIIEAPPDFWDASVHEPLKGSKHEAGSMNWKAVQSLSISKDDKIENGTELQEQAIVHVFPEFGPSLARLPFEEHQTAPERIF